MSEPAPIRGELVPLDTDAEAAPAGPLTLFGTNDPRVALARMSDLARVLVDVVRDRKLFVPISGREHLTAEAWTTLGGMLGVVPVVVWTRPNETGDGYLARVEARTLDGRVVGAAESECTRAEANWEKRDAFALRSMAQTRAIGRALRAPLGQIVVLAGYEPAGAEEMPTPTTSEPKPKPELRPEQVTPEQKAEIKTLLASLEEIEPETDWPACCRELVGGLSFRELTQAGAQILIRKLHERLEGLAGGGDD